MQEYFKSSARKIQALWFIFMVRYILPVSLWALGTALAHRPRPGTAQAGGPRPRTRLPQAAGKDPAACQLGGAAAHSPLPIPVLRRVLKPFADGSRHGLLTVQHSTAESWEAQAQRQAEGEPETLRMRGDTGRKSSGHSSQPALTPPHAAPAIGAQASDSAVQAPGRRKRRSSPFTWVLLH